MSENYQELLKFSTAKFETEIFSLLADNQLMTHNTEFVHNFNPKIQERMDLQKESIQNKIELLVKYMGNGGKLEDFDKGILFDLICAMVQMTLSYFEMFKDLLVCCIDLSKIGISEEKPLYDEIVDLLGDYKNDGILVFHKAGLRTFFNVNLRNSLIHDSWWINHNSEFTYKESDETEISLSIGELHGELAGINAIVVAFTENYLKIFDKNMLEHLKHENPGFFNLKKDS